MHDQASELRELVKRAAGVAPVTDAPRLVAVAGGHSRVGTTTLAVNLASCWSARGLRVVLVEADLERGAAAHLCDVEESPSIVDVLAGQRSLPSCAQRGPAGLRVVPGVWGATTGSEFDTLASLHLCRELQSLHRQTEVVVLDLGRGQHEFGRRVWQAADEVLLVAAPSDRGIMDAYTQIKLAARHGAPAEVGIVVNRADSEVQARDVAARLDRSCRKFLATSAELRGWLPDDDCCISAEQLRRPLVLRFPQTRAALAIAALAATLVSRERQEMQAA